MEKIAAVLILVIFAAVTVNWTDSPAQADRKKDKHDEKKVDVKEKRACPKCKQEAFSDWWKFCPKCGAELPAVKAKNVDNPEKPFEVNGNVYRDSIFNFQIERPNEDWLFLTGEFAQLLSPGSRVALGREGAYAIVGLETVKDMKLEDYLARLQKVMADSGAADVVEQKQEKITINKHDGIKSIMTAKMNGVKFCFIYAVFDNKGRKFRIAMWSEEEKFKAHEAEFDAILNSFTIGQSKPTPK